MKKNKAIFVCGAGGSGKSTFIKNYLKQFTHIDVDIFYEELLQKAGLGLDIKNFKKSEIKLSNRLFNDAVSKNDSYFIECIKNKNDVVIESIGRNVDVIFEQRYNLELVGYDTYMIIIYTELDECINRVEKRTRSYDKSVTIKSWNDVYSNIENYKNFFKEKCLIISKESIISNEIINNFINSTAEVKRIM